MTAASLLLLVMLLMLLLMLKRMLVLLLLLLVLHQTSHHVLHQGAGVEQGLAHAQLVTRTRQLWQLGEWGAAWVGMLQLLLLLLLLTGAIHWTRNGRLLLVVTRFRL